MEKINLVEILKDCPKGMALDCTMFDNANFIGVENYDKPICIRIGNGDLYFHLTKFGTWNFDDNAKCVIFPKGKTTWERFVPPCKFKDGDIIADEHGNIAIYKGTMWYNKKFAKYYCGYRKSDNHFLSEPTKDGHFGLIEELHLATEEEKAKLFQAIKDNGYQWNPETKTLEKLRMFEVGDRVRLKSKPNYVYTIHSLTWDDNNKLAYRLLPDNDKHLRVISLIEQNEYELIPNKFNITTLKPFESRVLVRNANNKVWRPTIFGCYMKDKYEPFYVLGGTGWKQCIPYKNNEYLLGTTDDCNEYFKTWE